MAQLAAARERSRRIRCASNLRQIGQGLMLYADANKTYPRVRYDPTPGAKLNYHTGFESVDPFGKNGPEINDITAAVFLLVRNCDLSMEVFLCPSMTMERLLGDKPPQPRWWTKTWKEDSPQNMANFPAPETLDYSLTQPYPDKNAIDRGYKWSANVSADWVIAADKNPGGADLLKLTTDSPAKEMRGGNSANHRRDGQNVLFNDGHVEWQTTAFAGASRDNIYTRAKVRRFEATGEWIQLDVPASEEGTQPACPLDSVLLPTSEGNGTTRPAR